MSCRLVFLLATPLLITALASVGCDSSSPSERKETVSDAWEGEYSGIGKEVVFQDGVREEKEGLDATLRLEFSDARELDSLYFRYAPDDSSVKGLTAHDAVLLTKDTIVTSEYENEFEGGFGKVKMTSQVKVGRENGLVKGSLWRYYAEDEGDSDYFPDSTLARFTVSPESR